MIRKVVRSRCWYCNSDSDGAEHALFYCPRWIRERNELKNHVGTSMAIDNLIALLVKKEDNWTKFQVLCNKIMKSRLAQEKIEERKRRR